MPPPIPEKKVGRHAPDGNPNEPERTGILVVGDWLVDEHWVVGKHRAFSSSRTGREHSRALHAEQCSVRSLCGAGQVATILYQAKSGDQRPFQINGIGIWHPDDEPVLTHMLNPSFNVGRTPHLLRSDEYVKLTPIANDDVKLFSLTPRHLEIMAGTTRIIRIYKHLNGQVDLDRRIDWELPLTESDFRKIRKGIGSALEGMEDLSIAIQHIFVTDLLKGAVSAELIHWLRQTFHHASWYVSSKSWRPAWFKELPKTHVKLILVPQQAAQRAIITGEISSSSWITSAGVASQDAIKAIDDLAHKFGSAKIVVLPEGMSVMARDGSNGYVLPIEWAADALPFTPMASVFYPALGALLIRSKDDFFRTLQNAIAFTETWEKAEVQRTIINNWKPTPDQILSLDETDQQPNLPSWRRFNWAKLSEEWLQAFSGTGVVTVYDRRKPKEEFQLWRAMTDIHSYVTCIPSKRKSVLALLREGQSLKQAVLGDRRHKSFYVVDQPGSGKSYMIECLASTLGMQYRKFNITALSSRDDLADCFQSLSAAQSESPNEPLMVFFDEMNTRIGGHHVYDVFLEPLEDGKYLYHGKTFHLNPCLWIFAGTEAPTAGKDHESKSNKAPDFETRLTRPVMYLSGLRSEAKQDSQDTLSEERLQELRRVEQVYLGVAAVRREFEDVTRVSKKVLEAFSLIDPDKIGPRGIRRFVRSFEYVQYSRVMRNNLPDKWHVQMEIVPRLYEHWRTGEDSENLLVEIKSRIEG